MMKCPKCQTESLNEFAVQGVRVDRCASCNGIWFDARELSQLLAEDSRHVATLRRGNAKDEAGGKKGFCPRDVADLLRVFSTIERSVILDAVRSVAEFGSMAGSSTNSSLPGSGKLISRKYGSKFCLLVP